MGEHRRPVGGEHTKEDKQSVAIAAARPIAAKAEILQLLPQQTLATG